MKKLFFIGIGGSGMNSLALFSRAEGHEVWGSDRSFDSQHPNTLQSELLHHNIRLTTQDGKGLPDRLDAVIYSAAIEETNLDFKSARERKIPLLPRARFLADIFNAKSGIAVSGTSGKSTVTGMIAQVLETSGRDFSFISGGRIRNFGKTEKLCNWKSGKGPLMLIEADESDGTLVLYKPDYAIVTNISKDHKEMNELFPMFEHLMASTRQAVILNKNCPFSQKLKDHHKNILWFGKSDARNLEFKQSTSSFETIIGRIHLKVPGLHNIENALCAMQTCLAMGLSTDEIRHGLGEFSGIERRLDFVGSSRGISVYDDFSHNPAKIEAAIDTLKTIHSGLRIIYQPHGFGPLKQQWNDLADVFAKILGPKDILYLLPVYDAGGTADRSISSEDFCRYLKAKGCQTEYYKARTELIRHVKEICRPQEAVIVMGARDGSLTLLAQDIFKALKA